jgi:hypothetical protein
MKTGDFFSCDCGRQQAYADENTGGGITEKEAEQIGWRKVGGKWRCPFCCNNLGVLKNIFYKKTHQTK